MASGREEELISAEKEERNRRAFEGWLMRKEEERKLALEAKQKPLVGLSEGNRKSIMANRAYQQWLLNKQREEQQKKKEKKVEQEWKALQEKQRQVEQDKAQISFSSWKQRKEFERNFKYENSRPSSGRDTLAIVRETPLLPGYCSVWSCDEELADHMVARVQRSQIS